MPKDAKPNHDRVRRQGRNGMRETEGAADSRAPSTRIAFRVHSEVLLASRRSCVRTRKKIDVEPGAKQRTPRLFVGQVLLHPPLSERTAKKIQKCDRTDYCRKIIGEIRAPQKGLAFSQGDDYLPTAPRVHTWDPWTPTGYLALGSARAFTILHPVPGRFRLSSPKPSFSKVERSVRRETSKWVPKFKY